MNAMWTIFIQRERTHLINFNILNVKSLTSIYIDLAKKYPRDQGGFAVEV
jgi:hypothetical protein